MTLTWTARQIKINKTLTQMTEVLSVAGVDDASLELRNGSQSVSQWYDRQKTKQSRREVK